MSSRVLPLALLLFVFGLPKALGVVDTVWLYEQYDFKGRSVAIDMPGSCIEFDTWEDGIWNNNVRSINTDGNCIVLYDNENCGGRHVVLGLFNGHYHNDLRKFKHEFADKMTSMRPCSQYEAELCELNKAKCIENN